MKRFMLMLAVVMSCLLLSVGVPEVEAQTGTVDFIGSYDTPGSAIGVTVVGSYAYIADGDSGLQIINISNPANPTLTGSYDTTGDARWVTVVGSYAYIADGDSGLQIINISNPANPTLAGSYDTPDNTERVTVVGSYAYLADWESGLQIINISNPANPTLTGSYDTPGDARWVTVVGSYAYIADVYSFQIINISNPANPTLAGSYDTTGDAFGVTVVGSYAYIADKSSGLQIINISNPANPTLTGSYDTPGIAYGVTVVGSYAYLADWENGLVVVRFNDGQPIPVSGKIYIPVVVKHPQPVSIYNGDFEQGAVGWTVSSARGADVIVSSFTNEKLPVSAHGGQWAAWLGGLSDETSYIRKQVTVPSNAPYLTYWHWIASADNCGYDFGGVGVGGYWYDKYDLCDDTNTNGWVIHSVDLRNYAGQTISLDIAATTDDSNNSNLFVDDLLFQYSRVTTRKAPQYDPTIRANISKTGEVIETKQPPNNSPKYTD